jgi:hypothetical protein
MAARRSTRRRLKKEEVLITVKKEQIQESATSSKELNISVAVFERIIGQQVSMPGFKGKTAVMNYGAGGVC